MAEEQQIPAAAPAGADAPIAVTSGKQKKGGHHHKKKQA